MKFLLLSFLVMFFIESFGQEKNHAFSSEYGVVFSLNSFTSDSLVPGNRREKFKGIADTYLTASYLFPLRESSFRMKVGLGYVKRKFAMNKTSVGETILSLMPLVFNRVDSFYVRQVRINNEYINLPVGIFYRLGKPKTVEVHAGLELDNMFLLSQNTSVVIDTVFFQPTPADETRIEKIYDRTSNKFLMNLHLRFDIRFKLGRSFAMIYSIEPLMIYVNSSHKRLIKPVVGIGGFFGLSYDF